MYIPTSTIDEEMDVDVRLRQTDNNSLPMSLSDYDFELDYVDNREIMTVHHNLYHLTLQAKLRVFLVLFVIIVIPATIVFAAFYIRDRRKQRQHEREMAALLSESPDPTLPYSARLSRPVPGSTADQTLNLDRTRGLRVSFADEKDLEGRKSTMSNSKRYPSLPDSPEEQDDDVFFVESSTNNKSITRPTTLPSGPNGGAPQNKNNRRNRLGSR